MNHNISSTDKARTVVIEEECDYVFVGGDDVDDIDDGRGGLGDLLNLDDGEEEYDEDGWDEVSYDYDRCDLSPSLSCATSVATNVTLRDLNLVVEDADVATSTTAATTAALMDVDDEDDDGDGGPTPMETEDARCENDRNVPASSAKPKNGRRLSNKKLRKKMKMMKKAAAARALAELKAASMSSSGAGSTSSESTASSSSSSTPGRVKSGGSDGWASLALACARESLLASRIVIEAEKEQLKKTRTVSISE